jgi:hypothetical protein
LSLPEPPPSLFRPGEAINDETSATKAERRGVNAKTDSRASQWFHHL